MLKKANEETTRNRTWNKDLSAGSVLEGVYVESKEVEGQYGKNIKYVIKENGTNELVDVFSSATLKRQFDNIPVESFVRISYKGDETTKNGYKVKIFEVEYDDEYQG